MKKLILITMNSFLLCACTGEDVKDGNEAVVDEVTGKRAIEQGQHMENQLKQIEQQQQARQEEIKKAQK